MTVFDTLRWPISTPPTVEQLHALPEDLYKNWIQNHTQDWRNYPHQEAEHVVQWMKRSLRGVNRETLTQEVVSDLGALRKLIQEYP